MLQERWGSSHVTAEVVVGKETVLVRDINYMAQSMALGNPNRLTEVVPNENF